jgi:hypothetical protein
VPLLEAEISVKSTTQHMPFPVFTGHQLGSSYLVWGMVPGVRMKDLVINLQMNRIRVEAFMPTDILPAWTPKDDPFGVDAFVQHIDLPLGFGTTMVDRQRLRNGTPTIELRKPRHSASTGLCGEEDPQGTIP